LSMKRTFMLDHRWLDNVPSSLNLPLHALDDAVDIISLDGRLLLDQLDKVTREMEDVSFVLVTNAPCDQSQGIRCPTSCPSSCHCN
jgi:hypothetical protein